MGFAFDLCFQFLHRGFCGCRDKRELVSRRTRELRRLGEHKGNSDFTCFFLYHQSGGRVFENLYGKGNFGIKLKFLVNLEKF